jgi:hypothetical protein
MLSFRLFREMAYRNEVGVYERHPLVLQSGFVKPSHLGKRISRTDTHTYHYEEGDDRFSARNSTTGEVDATVNGSLIKGHLHVDLLSTRPHGKLKAHEFYHHLITKHGVKLASTSQSPGATKVYQKLSKMKGVKIHGEDRDGGHHEIDIHKPERFLSPHYDGSPLSKLKVIASRA